MPGRQMNQGVNIPGATVTGNTVVNGYTVPVDLAVSSRSGTLPSEYVASTNVEFSGEFESTVSDEFVAYISDAGYAGTGNLGGGLSGSGGSYRYGFNGKENDNEIKGIGNQQDYGMRIYDPKLGRFLSVDPITKQYPELTPYQFASNSPIEAIDLDGLERSPAGKFGQYNEIVRDGSAVQLYPNAIPVIRKQKEDAPKLKVLMNAGSKPLATVEDGDKALFRSNLSNPDNIGGQAAFEIFQNVQNAKTEYREGNWVKGTLYSANAIINTGTLIGAGEALGVKSKAEVKTEPLTIKYPGLTTEYSKQTISQLKRTINSTSNTILEHVGYIKDPLSYPDMTKEKWEGFTPQYRQGLINKWKKDIIRNGEYLQIAKDLLKEKKS
jgi:RHS repeat-associated protein